MRLACEKVVKGLAPIVQHAKPGATWDDIIEAAQGDDDGFAPTKVRARTSFTGLCRTKFNRHKAAWDDIIDAAQGDDDGLAPTKMLYTPVVQVIFCCSSYRVCPEVWRCRRGGAG